MTAWKQQNGQRYKVGCSNMDYCILELFDEQLEFEFWLCPGFTSSLSSLLALGADDEDSSEEEKQ